ncbi:MAG TPA: class I SAM-dependent methyltransferase [Pyrinomonadaceae bacterium]|nr:class I SAM-dependent methyltransferase [Pyrinomonadaceae bacterium]
MSSDLERWERAEVERSAAEAAHFDAERLRSRDVARYLNPPADTCYPLEYSFHLLGDVRGLTVLEYGCGNGENTVALAKRGAGRVVALDISPDLIAIARRRLEANGVTSGVEFVVGSAHDVPLADESVDVVFGMAILHHLDLGLAAREVRRVLRKGGRAIFQEPVRSSPLLRAARKLIPYRAPDVSPFERPLTDRELEQFAEGYSSYRAKSFLLPSTNVLTLLPGLRRHAARLYRWDAAVLRRVPALNYYASIRVVEMVK